LAILRSRYQRLSASVVNEKCGNNVSIEAGENAQYCDMLTDVRTGMFRRCSCCTPDPGTRNCEQDIVLLNPSTFRFSTFWRAKDERHSSQSVRRNQSLGHLGMPVCIGPMVGDDRYEGLRLVTEPLATLGFEFDKPTLPLRILSQTNYYPALVQLYCRELLNHLFKANKRDQAGPPFKITSDDLDAAYKSQNLSDEINKRFRLTLDLDDRYKLITLVIANSGIEQSEFGAVSRPMRPEDVGQQCLKWCPALFENKTPSAFLALLEELVGLGVLSQQGREGFVLRSPNIVTMLGSADTITEELLSFEQREPLRPDRSAQRRMLEAQLGIPSPLTPAQEYRLLETDAACVSVVLASMATGLEYVERALRSISNRVLERELERLRSADELLRKVATRGRESGGGNRLMLVPYQINWNLAWIRRVSAVSKDLKERNIRVVFIGGPDQARTLVGEPTLAEEVDIESAELWTEATLRAYLAERERKDCDLPGLRRRILDAVGGTGDGARYLVNALGDKGEKFDAAAEQAFRELGRRNGLLVNFGIGPAFEPIYLAVARWSPCSDSDVKSILDIDCGGTTIMSAEGLIEYGIWMGALYRDDDLKININPLLRAHFQNQAT
jgi:hypothetical protein